MKVNNVVLVSSTAAHVRHLVEFGLTINEGLSASVSLIHMPSHRACTPSIPGLNQFVCSNNGIVSSTALPTVERTSFGVFSGKWRQKFNSLAFMMLVRIFEYILNRPLFYFLLLIKVVVRAIYPWSAGFHQMISGELIKDTFRTLGNLMRFFPEPSERGVGRLTQLMIYRVFWGAWAERWHRSAVDKFFSHLNPNLVVLPEMNWGYSHAIFIDYCRCNNVPLLILPYTIAGRQEWIASFKDDNECQVEGVFKRLVALAYPKWTLEFGERKLILPLRWILSCELMAVEPSDPWLTNSGPFGCVAVDNEITRDFYQQEGIDVTNWKVLGSLVEDRLYQVGRNKETHKRQLAGHYRVMAEKRWVVIAIPPDQFDSVNTESLQFNNYQALSKAIVEGVTQATGNGWDVIINLHPRCDRRSACVLEEAGGILVEESLETLLPLADIFVASVSATIRWAIACGIPTINFDVYRYRYKDFKSFPGVIEVFDYEDYLQQFRKMIETPGWLLCLREMQRQDSDRLFKLDGHGKARTLALVSDLMAQGEDRDSIPLPC